MRIELNNEQVELLLSLSESGMTYQRVDVTLKDGNCYEDLIVYNGKELELPAEVEFVADDITDIALHVTAEDCNVDVTQWKNARIVVEFKNEPKDCCFHYLGKFVKMSRQYGWCPGCKNPATKKILKEEILKQTKVQSVVLSRKKFRTVTEAHRWVKQHGFKVTKKPDTTPNEYRFRQFPPSDCVKNTFRTISLSDGVSAVICIPQGKKVPPGMKDKFDKSCGCLLNSG